MEKVKLFGDMDFDKIEKFEKDTNGIVLLNGFGENGVSFQHSNDKVIFYFDKVEEGSNECPNLFLLDISHIAKLFNFFAEYINNNPSKFKMRTP